jgi:archaellum component FlaC
MKLKEGPDEIKKDTEKQEQISNILKQLNTGLINLQKEMEDYKQTTERLQEKMENIIIHLKEYSADQEKVDPEKVADEIKTFYIEELKQYANKGKSESEKICLAAEQLKKLFIPQDAE